jgi:hypothetical protein
MQVRGFTRQVKLAEAMRGEDIYADLVTKVERVNAASPYGARQRANLTDALCLNVSRVPAGAFEVVFVNPDARPRAEEDDPPGTMFGIRGPYHALHLLVMPDLADLEEVETAREGRGVVHGSSRFGVTDVTRGFEASDEYTHITLGFPKHPLLGGNAEPDIHDRGGMGTITVWAGALGL